MIILPNNVMFTLYLSIDVLLAVNLLRACKKISNKIQYVCTQI